MSDHPVVSPPGPMTRESFPVTRIIFCSCAAVCMPTEIRAGVNSKAKRNLMVTLVISVWVLTPSTSPENQKNCLRTSTPKLTGAGFLAASMACGECVVLCDVTPPEHPGTAAVHCGPSLLGRGAQPRGRPFKTRSRAEHSRASGPNPLKLAPQLAHRRSGCSGHGKGLAVVGCWKSERPPEISPSSPPLHLYLRHLFEVPRGII